MSTLSYGIGIWGRGRKRKTAPSLHTPLTIPPTSAFAKDEKTSHTPPQPGSSEPGPPRSSHRFVLFSAAPLLAQRRGRS